MTNTYIKLFVGALLFGTLVALTVFQVPHDDRLLDLIYAALVGLGIYHLGDRDGNIPATYRQHTGNIPGTYREGGAPTDKQSGNAHVGLLALTGLTGALLMSGCATGQPQTMQATFTQGCAAYGAAFSVALELRRAGQLNRSQIDQITLLDSQITPLCTGPLPADATAATQQVTAAVTTLAIIEAIKETK